MADLTLDDIRGKIAGLGDLTQPNASQDVVTDAPVTNQGNQGDVQSQPIENSLNNSQDEDQKYQNLLDEDIVTLLGKDNLGPDEQEDIRNKATEDIEKMALSQITNSLSPEKQVEFNAVLSNKDNAAISQFLSDNQISLKQVMLQAALIYKSDIVDSRATTTPGGE